MLGIDLSVPHMNEAYVVMDWKRSKPEVWIFVGSSTASGIYAFVVCPWDEAESSDVGSEEWTVTVSQEKLRERSNTLSPDGWVALLVSNHARYVGQTTFIP
jgi:hypothetical protein